METHSPCSRLVQKCCVSCNEPGHSIVEQPDVLGQQTGNPQRLRKTGSPHHTASSQAGLCNLRLKVCWAEQFLIEGTDTKSMWGTHHFLETPFLGHLFEHLGSAFPRTMLCSLWPFRKTLLSSRIFPIFIESFPQQPLRRPFSPFLSGRWKSQGLNVTE